MNTTSVQGKPRTRYLAWLTAAFMALLLSACGAGDGKDNSEAQASAANQQTPPPMQLVMGYFEPNEDRWRYDLINLISPQSGRIVWSLQADNLSADTSATMGFDATGLPVSHGAAQRLFYVAMDKGHVYTVTLRGDSNPQPRQLTTVSDACSIERVINSDGTGDSAWVLVSLAGANKQCDGPEWWGSDDQVVLVGSWQTPTDAAISFNVRPSSILVTPYTTAGQFKGLLWSNVEGLSLVDTRGVRHDLLDASLAQARFLSLVPGNGQQAYIQAGQKIHVLDWSGDKLTLVGSQPAAVLKTASLMTTISIVPSWATEEGLYFVDDARLWRLDGQHRLTSVATLPDVDLNNVLLHEREYTANELLLIQHHDLAPGGARVQAISRTSGSLRTVYQTPEAAQMAPIIKVNGRVAIILQAEDQTNTRWTIARVDLSTGNAARVMACGVSILNMLSTHDTHAALTHLTWCQADAAGTCPVSSVMGYNVAQDVARPLATNDLARTEANWSIVNIQQADATNNPAFTSYTPVPAGGHLRKVWRFEPDTVGSLKLVQ